MRRNFRLILAYDGTAFHGWQTQPGVRTVQEEVTRVLRQIVREPVVLFGASRTDAGVHARGQCANFHAATQIPALNLFRAIGHHLPPDIALLNLHDAPPDFHASRAARSKLYRYSIFAALTRPCRDRLAQQTWHVWHPLDVQRMRAAAELLIGTHDFVAFASRGSPRENTVRRIEAIEIRRQYERILIDVQGTGFLYNQVRNMVGTLVEVGRGHWEPPRVTTILASRDRTAAGPTAPPQGLCLEWIRYDAEALRCRGSEPPDAPGGTRPEA